MTTFWTVPVVPHEAVPEVSKGRSYNPEEHVPIESFVTTLIDERFFSDDRNEVGICWLCRSTHPHATASSRWRQSLPNRVRSQSATTCDSSYAPNSAQYYSLLQSTTPVLLCSTQCYSALQSTTPVLLCTTKTPVLQSNTPVLLQYYSVLHCTTPVSLLSYSWNFRQRLVRYY